MELRCVVIALACASILVASSAGAEIYKWTDAEGVVHFTSNPDEVPAAQRARAAEAGRAGKGSFQRVVPSGASAAARAPAAPAPPRSRAGAKKASREAGEERVGGRTEAEWRAEAEKHRSAIARLEPLVERCKDDSFRFSEGAGRRAYREEEAEVDGCRKLRDEKDMHERWLETLEEKAHSAGVPPGWIRD